jgi:aryl-alcohol dehydrogenase-like predicted oxidoreductase
VKTGWGSSKDESRRIYDHFRDAGSSFIDTASVYTNGTSETFPAWTPFVALQVEYSLVERTVECGPTAKALGLTVTAWSPLGGGLLTGSTQAHVHPPAGGRTTTR